MNMKTILLSVLAAVIAAIFYIIGSILSHEHKPKFYYVSGYHEPCIMINQDWEPDEIISLNVRVDGNIGIQQMQIICDSLNKSLQKNIK